MGNTTRQGWTIEGKPAWREGPDGAREEWQWDTEGNLARHTDQAGHTTTYTHTHFDKLATRTDPDGAHYAFTYDTELRLTEVTNAQGRKWHYTYDAAGRLTEETDFNGAKRTYEPDAAGRLTAWTNALGETLRYTLDPAGRVVAQCDASTGEVTTYTYGANGSLSRAANADTELVVERSCVLADAGSAEDLPGPSHAMPRSTGARAATISGTPRSVCETEGGGRCSRRCSC
ncbi:hypothetical protein [Streptomyces sp. PSAA01]|uniref:hypothetical protein n=1 Tax=Streptomyces sp. PSAA01 TaxID=2912762 RepID=UPI0035ABCA69